MSELKSSKPQASDRELARRLGTALLDVAASLSDQGQRDTCTFAAGIIEGQASRIDADGAEIERLRETIEVNMESWKECGEENRRLRADLGAKQARIDALMLEYCPDEMTPKQRAEWAENQIPADETAVCQHEKEWSDGAQLYHCKKCDSYFRGVEPGDKGWPESEVQK